jgi:CheY-like chemotaxis protein
MSNLQILFVEDDLSNKFLLKLIFRNSPYSFQIAENGQEALQMISENNFDIIFLDIHLPDMDGFEVAKKIRALEDPLKCNIPIISMSANEPYQEEILFKLKSSGINGFISKPFTEEEIEEELQINLKYASDKRPKWPQANDRPTIDKNKLLKITKGDPQLIKNMIEILVKQKKDSFIKFETGLTSNDWKLIENTAHSLKSSILFFGMDFLFDTVDKIEINALEKKNLDEISALVELVRSGIDKSVEELNKTYR